MALLFGSTEKGEDYSVMVKRSGDVVVSPFETDNDDHFAGTLLDGELMTSSGRPTLKLFDAYVVSGYEHSRVGYLARLETLRAVHASLGSQTHKVEVKTFYPLTPGTVRQCAAKDGVDGVIVTHSEDPVQVYYQTVFIFLYTL